jgi:hypothetical protein
LDSKEKKMRDDEIGQQGSGDRLDDFMNKMCSQGFCPTPLEERAASALLNEKFSIDEVAAFFRSSAWLAFHRECSKKHHLPWMPTVDLSLRESFDRGLSHSEAADAAIEALRKQADEEDWPCAPASDADCPPRPFLWVVK